MLEDGSLQKEEPVVRSQNEKKLIREGALKEESPLDLSEGFKQLCDACRRGDLKVCQEKISEGVNINARDSFDYTPLILVCSTSPRIKAQNVATEFRKLTLTTGELLWTLRGSTVVA